MTDEEFLATFDAPSSTEGGISDEDLFSAFEKQPTPVVEEPQAPVVEQQAPQLDLSVGVPTGMGMGMTPQSIGPAVDAARDMIVGKGDEFVQSLPSYLDAPVQNPAKLYAGLSSAGPEELAKAYAADIPYGAKAKQSEGGDWYIETEKNERFGVPSGFGEGDTGRLAITAAREAGLHMVGAGLAKYLVKAPQFIRALYETFNKAPTTVKTAASELALGGIEQGIEQAAGGTYDVADQLMGAGAGTAMGRGADFISGAGHTGRYGRILKAAEEGTPEGLSTLQRVAGEEEGMVQFLSDKGYEADISQGLKTKKEGVIEVMEDITHMNVNTPEKQAEQLNRLAHAMDMDEDVIQKYKDNGLLDDLHIRDATKRDSETKFVMDSATTGFLGQKVKKKHRALTGKVDTLIENLAKSKTPSQASSNAKKVLALKYNTIKKDYDQRYQNVKKALSEVEGGLGVDLPNTRTQLKSDYESGRRVTKEGDEIGPGRINSKLGRELEDDLGKKFFDQIGYTTDPSGFPEKTMVSVEGLPTISGLDAARRKVGDALDGDEKGYAKLMYKKLRKDQTAAMRQLHSEGKISDEVLEDYFIADAKFQEGLDVDERLKSLYGKKFADLFEETDKGDLVEKTAASYVGTADTAFAKVAKKDIAEYKNMLDALGDKNLQNDMIVSGIMQKFDIRDGVADFPKLFNTLDDIFQRPESAKLIKDYASPETYDLLKGIHSITGGIYRAEKDKHKGAGAAGLKAATERSEGILRKLQGVIGIYAPVAGFRAGVSKIASGTPASDVVSGAGSNALTLSLLSVLRSADLKKEHFAKGVAILNSKELKNVIVSGADEASLRKLLGSSKFRTLAKQAGLGSTRSELEQWVNKTLRTTARQGETTDGQY